MAARGDDSVIRGSLITCMILLVLSMAANFFFYRWGNIKSTEYETAKSQLDNARGSLAGLTSQTELMKSMLGSGEKLSEEAFTSLSQNAGSDPDMDAIEKRFVQDMTYFGPEVDASSRNYPDLPEYLVNAIRDRNVQFGQAVQEAKAVRAQADSDVQNAKQAQNEAEKNRDNANVKLDQATVSFTEDRTKMKKSGEELKDQLNKTVQDSRKELKRASDEKGKLVADATNLKSTIENQRRELSDLRSDKFENVQGELTHVIEGGDLVIISLGSSDALRAGVQFGVIAADSINIQEAPLKATIEVVKVVNANSSQCRVLGNPSYRNPLIQGDKIYSPFWAPGRKVRIALAGDIDIDNDDRSDIEQLRSMIALAGAEVAFVLTRETGREGEFDANVRFLVIGEKPASEADANASAGDDQFAKDLGELKREAIEKGVTVIPAWKLLAYLKTIDDSVTTPLGSAVRGEDFAPERMPDSPGRRIGSVLPELYRKQVEGQPKP